MKVHDEHRTHQEATENDDVADLENCKISKFVDDRRVSGFDEEVGVFCFGQNASIACVSRN